jgi:hypothetical protein
MLILNVEWDAIRASFTEEEKVALREAVTGQIVCPASVMIEENRLSPALYAKLDAQLATLRPKAKPTRNTLARRPHHKGKSTS